MRDSRAAQSATPGLTADRVVCRDSIGRSLLEATAQALRGAGCAGLDQTPVLGRLAGMAEEQRRMALAREAHAEAVPADAAHRIDADAIATWIVGHYPAPQYPGVIIGSPHGAAAHLAAALGAPWLPTSFAVTVSWPGGSAGDWGGAMRCGAVVAERLLAANPAVTVRQVHDLVRRGSLCASTLTLHVRWRRLPAAYRAFLRSRIEPGGPVLTLRDIGTWPVLHLTSGYTFQIGSPASGWRLADYTLDNPCFRRLLKSIGGVDWDAPYLQTPPRYTEAAGEPDLEHDLRLSLAELQLPAHRVLYPNPEALSACVADLYRDLLGPGGGAACVVETGRLLDPWHVLAAGLVPYWCESASRRAVDAAEWWLAGSAAFDSIIVLPEPPGTACEAHAGPAQWGAVAAFARHRSHVDRLAMSRYPLLPLPTSHVASRLPPPRPSVLVPPVLPMGQVLAGLRLSGPQLGLLVL
ncbi:MAG: hypothetical protein ACJ786_10470 [Catenulispora sp.]